MGVRRCSCKERGFRQQSLSLADGDAASDPLGIASVVADRSHPGVWEFNGQLMPVVLMFS